MKRLELLRPLQALEPKSNTSTSDNSANPSFQLVTRAAAPCVSDHFSANRADFVRSFDGSVQTLFFGIITDDERPLLCPSLSQLIKVASRRRAGCLSANLDICFSAGQTCSSRKGLLSPFRGRMPLTPGFWFPVHLAHLHRRLIFRSTLPRRASFLILQTQSTSKGI